MAMATFRHGNPIMVDYTPASGNVAVGDIVVIHAAATNSTTGADGLVGIAHRPILNNTLGSLAVAGGVYAVINLNNAATGAAVFFDGTNKATTVTNTLCFLGKIVANGGGGANTTCYVATDFANV